MAQAANGDQLGNQAPPPQPNPENAENAEMGDPAAAAAEAPAPAPAAAAAPAAVQAQAAVLPRFDVDADLLGLLLLDALRSDSVTRGLLGGNRSVPELAVAEQLPERVLLLGVALVAEVRALAERLRVALVVLEIRGRDPGLLALRSRLLQQHPHPAIRR